MGATRRTDLLRRPNRPEPGVVTRVTAADAGWESLGFEVRRLGQGERWEHGTGDAEAVLVVLGGRCAVTSDRGEWPAVGGRADVFSGMPWALYLPRRTSFCLVALDLGVEVAHGWAPAGEGRAPRLVAPDQVEVELRGGGPASRQINRIVPPGFDCQRLVCVEVFTPGGNWSSYPPHKHDEHLVGPDGALLEADLDEVYFYKIDRPSGFALQRVYTGDGRLDETVAAATDDVVLVPEGYHPVAVPVGYTCYYLNFLAGSAQSLAATDDPAHAWVKTTWAGLDPRVPVIPREPGARAREGAR
jgi:5-deoxy-glucuronate isomerase